MRRFMGLLAMACVAALAPAQPPEGDGKQVEIAFPGKAPGASALALEGQVWWVLFNTPGDGVRLRYVPLHVSGDARGCGIAAEGFEASEVVLLFRGTVTLPRGPVSTSFVGELPLHPGDSLRLGQGYPGSADQIVATLAGKHSVDIGLGRADQRQRLVDKCEDVVLRWAGDLDHDDRLDYLLQYAPKGGTTERALYLSGHAVEGALVQCVAKAAVPAATNSPSGACSAASHR